MRSTFALADVSVHEEEKMVKKVIAFLLEEKITNTNKVASSAKEKTRKKMTTSVAEELPMFEGVI